MDISSPLCQFTTLMVVSRKSIVIPEVLLFPHIVLKNKVEVRAVAY